MSLRKTLYKMAWDTRCRNIDVARIVRPFVRSETTILDAGCGEYGLSAFLEGKQVVGIDILSTDVKADNFTFVHGSILSLPFPDRSFSIAASVDVLEHLPAAIRSGSVKQLVAVANEAVIVTFPSGVAARSIDEDFAAKLSKTGQPLPDWLREHLENPYPEAEEIAGLIQAEADRLGRKVTITTHHSESLTVARRLRNAAATSKYLYLLTNVAAGMLLPLLPHATEKNAYRAIILAEFEND